VARSIVRESERTKGQVYLSLRHLDPEEIRRRFPMIAATCGRAGFDLPRDPIPVGPAAHYLMGGVETDLEGRTSIPGLFAAGEVACTRVHGANRLASNSLLEGLVFGARAGKAMAGSRHTADLPAPVFPSVPQRAGSASGPPSRRIDEEEIRALMWQSVGLFRNRERLVDAVNQLQEQEAGLANLDHQGWRRASIITVASLIANAALRREESRGGHFRTDFPASDDLHWKVHISDMKHHQK
jgi:L-aspartate oxidase